VLIPVTELLSWVIEFRTSVGVTSPDSMALSKPPSPLLPVVMVRISATYRFM